MGRTAALAAATPASDHGFDGLYRDRRLAMVRLAVLLVDRRVIADEVVQEAFAAVYARWAPDGTFVTVRALGVSAAELDDVVAGVGPADRATWTALADQVSVSIAALPVATSARWDEVELTIRGTARAADAVPGQWQPTGACVRVGDGGQRCGAFSPSGGATYGPMVVSPAGWTYGRAMSEGGTFITTVTDGSAWWVLGANEMNEAVRVSVGEEPVADQWSTRQQQQPLVFVARLPGDAPSTALAFGYLHLPEGTEVPQTGVPEWREQRRDVDRPRS